MAQNNDVSTAGKGGRKNSRARFTERAQAELLSQVDDLLNEGKAMEVNELIQKSGDLGKSIVPSVAIDLLVRLVFNGTSIPEGLIEDTLADIKEYEEHLQRQGILKNALKESRKERHVSRPVPVKI
jgi:hypothetical protein